MPNIPGYKETAGNVFVREEGDKKWIYAYNGTGAAVNNGDVYQVSYLDDTDGYYPKLLAPATDSVAHAIIGVVENSAAGKGTIASDEWGWVQVRGLCYSYNTGGVTDEHCVEILNGNTKFTTEGNGTITANTVGIAKGAQTTLTLGTIYLLGRENVVIAAS